MNRRRRFLIVLAASDPVRLLSARDWSARWIENCRCSVRRSPSGGRSSRLASTRPGSARTPPRSTTVRSGTPCSNPGQTTYAAEVGYRIYDLTRALRPGANTLALQAGSGTYQRVKTPGRS